MVTSTELILRYCELRESGTSRRLVYLLSASHCVEEIVWEVVCLIIARVKVQLHTGLVRPEQEVIGRIGVDDRMFRDNKKRDISIITLHIVQRREFVMRSLGWLMVKTPKHEHNQISNPALDEG